MACALGGSPGGENEGEEDGEADEAQEGPLVSGHRNGHSTTAYTPAPAHGDAKRALDDLTFLLKPRNTNGRRIPFEGDDYLRSRLELMESFLHLYVTHTELTWIAASNRAADAKRQGVAAAKTLRKQTRAFLADRHDLPCNPYGQWSTSLLDDGDLAQELNEYLQGIGKYIKAMDVVEFLADPEVQQKYGLTKTVCLSTATSWLKSMGYRWMQEPSGQYVDGHERADVVDYRQTKYLPALLKHEGRLRIFVDGVEYEDPEEVPFEGRHVVRWYHDESTFFANDRRRVRWVHKSENAAIRPKGEGVSIMVSDFFSADYGWLRSRDGNRSARVLFRAGKNREGYFTYENIISQLTDATDILASDYADDIHVFILDNAPTHLKRGEDSLSARHMSKFATKPGNPQFGVWVPDKTDDGKLQYCRDGKVLKKKIPMQGAQLPDGTPQSLYFEAGTENEGVFKGMAQILRERGYTDTDGLRAECPGFKCSPVAAGRCCMRRFLYEQPDFQRVKTLVETHCEARGVEVIFLPKYHCDLNPIEQCWAHGKRTYREMPPSKSEDELERNVVVALDSIPLEVMRK